MDSQLVRTAGQQPLIVACLPDADEEKAAQLQEKGVEVLRIPGVTTADITEEQKEVISLPVLMKELGARKIDGILLEGGGQLNESALQAGIVDRIYCYIAPKIFGIRAGYFTGIRKSAGIAVIGSFRRKMSRL